MSQMKYVVDPFGEVNVYPQAGGKVRVTATILMEPHREGDANRHRHRWFRLHAEAVRQRDGCPFVDFRIAKSMKTSSALLPRKSVPIWPGISMPMEERPASTGQPAPAVRKSKLSVIFTPTRPRNTPSSAPINLGREPSYSRPCSILSSVSKMPTGAFMSSSPMANCTISMRSKTTRENCPCAIAAGKRNPLKMVLIGVGPDVNERQMEQLDDLDTGTDIDLWDHKIAAEMRVLQQMFAEVVDKNARVAASGRILTPDGKVVKNYGDTGVPAFLEFEISAACDYFTLDVPGHRVHQPLKENAIIPEDEVVEERTKPQEAEAPYAEVVPETKEVEDQSGFDFKLEFEKDPVDMQLDPSEVQKQEKK